MFLSRFIFLFAVLSSYVALGQDTIVKTNRTILVGKVLDVSKDEITYRSGGDDMPIRVVSKKNVQKIVYFNGFVLDFARQDNQGEMKSKFSKGQMLGSSFYFSGQLGVMPGAISSNSYVYSPLALYYGTSIGSKWYFGKNQKARFGINANWMRSTMFNEIGGIPDYFILSPAGVGLASAFDLGGNSGLEFNTHSSFLVNIEIDFGVEVGMINGIELNYRFKKFVIGFDYSIYSFDYNRQVHLFGINLGLHK